MSICPLCISEKKIPSHVCSYKTGIVNLGDTCYISAVLQILSELGIACTLNKNHPFSISYDSLNRNNSEFIILSDALKAISNLWRHSGQEDAFRFFTSLYRVMDYSKFIFTYKAVTVCFDCERVLSEDRRTDIGFVMNIAKDHYRSLQNQVNRADISVNKFCTNCCCRDAVEYRELDTLPDVLCVKIERYSFNISRHRAIKLTKRVPIPEILHISQTRYTLTCAILHSGKSPEKGHYSTYLHSESCLIDDERVFLNKRIKLDDPSFYIIYYSKTNN
jgi:uncharacterized UBP type Zn finger protein